MSISESKKTRWQKEIERRQTAGESLECTLEQFAKSVGELAADEELLIFLTLLLHRERFRQ